MALWEILTPESVINDANDFSRKLLEQSERRKAQAGTFENKFQNQNSEYDNVIKANNDLLKGASDTNESMFSSWSAFFKKIDHFLNGDSSNSEYQNVAEKLKEQKTQKNSASDLTTIQSTDSPEIAAQKAQLNETIARGQQMLNADLQGMISRTTTFTPSTTSHSVSSTSDTSSKGGDEYSFSRMLGKRMVESAKSMDFGINTAYYEGRSERAKSSYDNAVRKMKSSTTPVKDLQFWRNTADSAIKDMDYYGKKAAESKAKDKAGL